MQFDSILPDYSRWHSYMVKKRTLILRTLFFTAFVFLISNSSWSQNSFQCSVRDSVTREFIPGVRILVRSTGLGATTDPQGRAKISGIPDGIQTIEYSYPGYTTGLIELRFPLTDVVTFVELWLVPEQDSMDEVVVSATRSHARIEDAVQKTEVLGEEEMDEESALVPGSVVSILGDLAVITIQRTDPLNGNDVLRMQGLDGRYTQILRDGFPLYGGFSGSLGVLAIPPLDLRQVEIIKGCASTLYGGGAIGGLINLVSREPGDSASTVFSANYTTLNELDLNTFIATRKGKWGMTVNSGYTGKQAVDRNADLFTDVPDMHSYFIHARGFLAEGKGQYLNAGVSISQSSLMAGVLTSVLHPFQNDSLYVNSEDTHRITGDLQYDLDHGVKNKVTARFSASAFDRRSEIPGYSFSGRVSNFYSEVNDLLAVGPHEIVYGFSFTTEDFRPEGSDSSAIEGHHFLIPGVFAQADWKLLPSLVLQTGIRVDQHNVFGTPVLPRIALFWKAASNLSFRVSSGTGYKIPDLFEITDPASDLQTNPIAYTMEKARGGNCDINYSAVLSESIGLQANQAFYYTRITDPAAMAINSSGMRFLVNLSSPVQSYGTDTYVRLTIDEVEVYLGYNHTVAVLDDEASTPVPYNPQDKFAATVAWQLEHRWRAGIEAAWMGHQFVDNGRRVPDFWFFAAMVERQFRRGSIVVNCENLGDFRQTDFEPVITGDLAHPDFQPLWAPIEGRIINCSIRIAI